MALVLVVDDEFGIVRLLEDVLTDEGHTVVVAVNGSKRLTAPPRHGPTSCSPTS